MAKPGGYVLVTVPYRRCINSKLRKLLRPIVRLLVPLYALLNRPVLHLSSLLSSD